VRHFCRRLLRARGVTALLELRAVAAALLGRLGAAGAALGVALVRRQRPALGRAARRAARLQALAPGLARRGRRRSGRLRRISGGLGRSGRSRGLVDVGRRARRRRVSPGAGGGAAGVCAASAVVSGASAPAAAAASSTSGAAPAAAL